ncbi:Bug family tripartite tricarboxylate transporter substrate binding protein [Falsiroseomonas sp. HW251]|uniref:Bug family tripartite tricarboxylate transporter substrate binding protein n=1 Tax=Falsiroseomonas sp. HW251 TaxID=3390998 RepID=UPI003D31B554
MQPISGANCGGRARSFRRRRLLLGLGGLALPRIAPAQEVGFSRPVRFIVPFPAGSTPDIAARALTERFRSAFGQSFVIENRVGASGNLGTQVIARATDGHTIGVSILGPLATAPAMFRDLGYDPMRDIAFVSNLVQAPQLLVVHPAVPARTLAEFVSYARANPGRLSFGSVGAGSLGHLSMEELKARFAMDLVHVPYRGFPQAVIDLVAGRIQTIMLSAAAILAQVREGTARPLVTTAHARSRQAPEVPTLAEAGVAGLESYGWIGLVAPGTAAPPLVNRLSFEAGAALRDEATRETLERVGFDIVASTPAEFARQAAADVERWGGLIRRLGVTPDA